MHTAFGEAAIFNGDAVKILKDKLRFKSNADIEYDGTNFDFGGKKLVSVGDPTATQDVTNKQYVDERSTPGGMNLLSDPSFEEGAGTADSATCSGTCGLVNDTGTVLDAPRNTQSLRMNFPTSAETFEIDVSSDVGIDYGNAPGELSFWMATNNSTAEACAVIDSVDYCVDLIDNDNKFTFYSIQFSFDSSPSTAEFQIRHTAGSTNSVWIDEVFFGANAQRTIETQEENVFSADIDNTGSGCTVLSENTDFIASCSRGGTGDITVTWKTGFFSVPPVVVCSTFSTGSDDAGCATLSSPTTTSARFQTRNHDTSGSAADYDFSIIVQRQGEDYNNPDERIVTETSLTTEAYLMQDSVLNFWDATGNIYTFDTSLQPLTGSKLIEWEDTTQTRLKAKRDVIVDVTIHGVPSGSSSIYIYASSNNTIARQYVAGLADTQVSLELKISQGDYIYFRQNNASSRYGGISITARPVKLDLMAGISKEFVKTPGLEAPMLYSAEISTSGVVSNEKGSFISGDCTNATPSVCTFETGAFTSQPNCWANTETASDVCNVTATLTTASVRCYTSAGGNDTPNVVKTLLCHGD